MLSATLLVLLPNKDHANDIVAGFIERGYSVSAADSGGSMLEASRVSAILGLNITRGEEGDQFNSAECPEEFEGLEHEDPNKGEEEEEEYDFLDELVDTAKVIAYHLGVLPLGLVANDASYYKWAVCRPKQPRTSAFERLGRDD